MKDVSQDKLGELTDRMDDDVGNISTKQNKTNELDKDVSHDQPMD